MLGFFYTKSMYDEQKKSRQIAGFLRNQRNEKLLNFSFFINHVLANGRIILFDLHFLWHVALIFVGSVKVSCPRTGH